MLSKLFRSSFKYSSNNLKISKINVSSSFISKRFYSLDLIKELRRQTDAPLGQCKKAIEASVSIESLYFEVEINLFKLLKIVDNIFNSIILLNSNFSL